MQTKTASEKQWTFEDLYNVLMERIEPELCTYNLDEMDEFYKEEKNKERVKRYSYYTECLDLFWDALKELIDLTKSDLKAFDEEFFSLLKQKISASDESGLSEIEKSIEEN